MLKNITATLLYLLLLGLFLGCSSHHSGFEVNTLEQNGYHYTEHKISDNYYRISVRSNTHPDIADKASQRATELTKQQGYDWFVIIEQATNVVDNDSTAKDKRTKANSKPMTEQVIEIRMGKGVKP